MSETLFVILNSLHGGGAEHVASRLSMVWGNNRKLVVISLQPLTAEDYEFSGECVSIAGSYTGVTWIGKLKNAAKVIDQLAESYRPDAMISFLQNSNLCLMLTTYRCKKIISIRNYIPQQYSGVKLKIWEYLIRRYFPKADYVVSASQLINTQMSQKYAILQSKCRCIYNPYSIDEIVECSKEGLNSEEQAFYAEHAVISNVGHVSRQKGQLHLIRILPELRKKIPNAGLVIVGKDTGEYADELKKLCEDVGVSEHVLFAGKQKNPYKFVNKSRVFAFPSLFEGFPNALVEAMICGIPVISSNCKSGPEEILTPVDGKEYGVLLPVDPNEYSGNVQLSDVEKQWVEAIWMMICEEGVSSRYVTLAEDRVKDFSIDTIAEEWEKILRG